jgi:hypothetical protein
MPAPGGPDRQGAKGRVDKPKANPFKDQRSAAAWDMGRAGEQSNHALFRDMLGRARRAGFRAAFVLAEAWFGCKENIARCLENNLTAIMPMKRGHPTGAGIEGKSPEFPRKRKPPPRRGPQNRQEGPGRDRSDRRGISTPGPANESRTDFRSTEGGKARRLVTLSGLN